MRLIRIGVVNCDFREDEKCNAEHHGGTPSAGTCELCTHREPIRPGPAVSWTIIESDEVSICTGRRGDYSVDAWQKLQAGRLRFEGERMIVPRMLFEEVTGRSPPSA